MRRGRGTAAARPDVAPDGPDAATNGADEPGARTIGAIALQRWAARRTGEPVEDADGGVTPLTRGPYDEGDLDPELTEADKVDFGAVRIPVPRGGQVSVEPEEGRLQAVHVMLPTGRLSVSALAAPRTDRLWPDLAAEIDESLREGGATVRSFTGEWGRELHARTGEASSVFVGVDGPRWMLYGVATGPTSSAEELDAALRRMLRGTVVVRGRLPYPVRTVLPLTVPEHLAEPAAAGSERVPVARGAEPSRRPAPGRPGSVGAGFGGAASAGPGNGTAPARPGGPTPSPRRPAPAPGAGEPPTEPHGLPRVAAGPDRNGRPRVNGAPAAASGRDEHVTGRPPAPGTPPAAQNGAAVRGSAPDRAAQLPPRADRSPVQRPDRDVGETGQRRVADLLAEAQRGDRGAGQTGQRRVADLVASAERERRTAQDTRGPQADAPHGAPRSGVPHTAMPQTGMPPSEVRPSATYRAAGPVPRPGEPAAGLPIRYDADITDVGDVGDIAPLRLGGAPRARDGGAGAVEPSRDDPRWAVGPSETVRAPGMGRPASRAARVTDGSDDWTVPMSVVPPEPTAPPDPSRDLWAGDPWAAEARRAAQAARAAEPPPAQPRPVEPREARSARNGAPADPRAARNGAPAHPRHDERAVYQRPAHQRPAHHRPAHERPGVVGPGGEPAVDVPAARVPPPLPSAFAPLADDRTDLFDEPTSGRHRRPER